MKRPVRAGVWLAVIAALALPGDGAARERRPPGDTEPLDAVEILRRAEQVRSPEVDYAADFALHTVSPAGRAYGRVASYTMIARGREAAMLLKRTPKLLFGASVLLTPVGLSQLSPRSTKFVQVSDSDLRLGEIAAIDLIRVDFSRGFTPRLGGEERFDGETCYKLEIERAAEGGRYARFDYWISKKSLEPRKLDAIDAKGQIQKMARYEDFRDGKLGRRPMRVVVESGFPWEDRSTIVFDDLRPVRADALRFTPEGLIALRDAAVARNAAQGPTFPIEDAIAALGSPGP